MDGHAIQRRLSKELAEGELLKEHARSLFNIFAAAAPAEYWDWQLLANKAFDAVEHFETVAAGRASKRS